MYFLLFFYGPTPNFTGPLYMLLVMLCCPHRNVLSPSAGRIITHTQQYTRYCVLINTVWVATDIVLVILAVASLLSRLIMRSNLNSSIGSMCRKRHGTVCILVVSSSIHHFQYVITMLVFACSHCLVQSTKNRVANPYFHSPITSSNYGLQFWSFPDTD